MNTLSQLRSSLEQIDQELLELVARRLSLAHPITVAKQSESLPIRDERQESEVLAKVQRIGRGHGLNPDRVDALFRLLLDWSVEEQRAAIQRDQSRECR